MRSFQGFLMQTPPPGRFMRDRQIRSKSEVLDASDLIYRLHGATRKAQEKKESPRAGLIPGGIQEWHHAINWITKYRDEGWEQEWLDSYFLPGYPKDLDNAKIISDFLTSVQARYLVTIYECEGCGRLMIQESAKTTSSFHIRLMVINYNGF